MAQRLLDRPVNPRIKSGEGDDSVKGVKVKEPKFIRCMSGYYEH
jgi:hypothetical protein